MKALGDRLKAARMNRGWTLEELGRECGCSQAFLSLIEEGKKLPSVGVLRRICEVLKVESDYLLGLKR